MPRESPFGLHIHHLQGRGPVGKGVTVMFGWLTSTLWAWEGILRLLMGSNNDCTPDTVNMIKYKYSCSFSIENSAAVIDRLFYRLL
jgi:carbon starvation protein CstA